jgi:hypothetical protein
MVRYDMVRYVWEGCHLNMVLKFGEGLAPRRALGGLAPRWALGRNGRNALMVRFGVHRLVKPIIWDAWGTFAYI